MESRYPAAALIAFSEKVLRAHGLAEEHASVTAQVLVEADLLGHRTHGIDLLPLYAGQLDEGKMTKTGEPTVISDGGANLLLDGRLLPGQVLISDALSRAMERAPTQGLVTIVIGNSQHTGCHAAYLRRPVEEGLLVILTSANRYGQRIAPFGGLDPLFSPSPFAVGIPSNGDPIIVDMTMASVANSVCRQHYQRQEQLPQEWLLDSEGKKTKDPAALYEEPRGTILPLGGLENGHKGMGLILFVNALTLALSGHGLTRDPEQASQSVFLQVIDPKAFAGRSEFDESVGWLADACRASRPAPGVEKPRLPGEYSIARRREQLEKGVRVPGDIRARLVAAGEEVGERFPAPTG